MGFKHNDLPIELDLPKLIRDKIPQIIKKNEGRKAKVRAAKGDKEFLSFVLKKIVEEAVELQNCDSKKDFVKGISDVEELILVLMNLKSIKRGEVERMKKNKLRKIGGFKKRYILERDK